MSEPSELEKTAQSLGLSKYQRHIFLCADQTEPKCCTKEAGLESWDFLKKRLKELEAENARLKKMYAEQRIKAGLRQEALEGKL